MTTAAAGRTRSRPRARRTRDRRGSGSARAGARRARRRECVARRHAPRSLGNLSQPARRRRCHNPQRESRRRAAHPGSSARHSCRRFAPTATTSSGSSAASRPAPDELRWDPAAGQPRPIAARRRRRDRQPQRRESRAALDRRAQARDPRVAHDDDGPPRPVGGGVDPRRPSSVRVGDRRLRESRRRDPDRGIRAADRISRRCRARREAAAEPAREAGIRVVHLRQGIVLAHDGGALGRMLLPFKLGLGGRIGSGKQWFSWVGMEDIVGAYRRSTEHRSERTRQRDRTEPGHERAVHESARIGALRGRRSFPCPASRSARSSATWATRCSSSGQRVLPAKLLDAGFEFAAPTIDVGLERALAE